MPHRKAHENTSIMILGHKYTRVHQWLDGTFSRKRWRTHRLDRHHLDAIGKKFKIGSPQYRAACLHVLLDFHQSFGHLCIPKDRKDAEKIFVEHGIL